MTGIAEMFADLDGRSRQADAIEVYGAMRWRRRDRVMRTGRGPAKPDQEALRARWRAAKKRRRASGKDADTYAVRMAQDAGFRERRRAYWRAYSARRLATDPAYAERKREAARRASDRRRAA